MWRTVASLIAVVLVSGQQLVAAVPTDAAARQVAIEAWMDDPEAQAVPGMSWDSELNAFTFDSPQWDERVGAFGDLNYELTSGTLDAFLD